MRRNVATAMMDAHAETVLERPGSPWRNFQDHVEDLARASKPCERDDVAPMHVFQRVDVSQIQCRPGSRSARFHVPAVRLYPADARRLAGWLQHYRLASAQATPGQRAGHH